MFVIGYMKFEEKKALKCILPWKALSMDEKNGNVVALPCCLSWIKSDYGYVSKNETLKELWNSEKAQYIRYLIINDRYNEICSPNCPNLLNGEYSEKKLRVLNGSESYVENQLLNNNEIKMRKTVLESKPQLLKVIPNLSCNLRCSMCFQKSYSRNSLSNNKWEEIANLLPFVHEITFQGGEATIDSQFNEFIKNINFTDQTHLHLSLITNATFFHPVFLQALKNVRLKYIMFSLNAASSITYKKITGKNFYQTVLKNIHKIKAITERKETSCDLFLSFVVMKSNYKEIPSFINLASNLCLKLRLQEMIGNRNNENVFTDSSILLELQNILKRLLMKNYNRQIVKEINKCYKIYSAEQYAFNKEE